MSALDFPTLSAPGQEPKITDIYKDFTSEAIEQIRKYLEINPPSIPIAQILGFSQYAAQAATVPSASGETTASTAFTDLATVGPQLTGLADGQYLILFGGAFDFSAGGGADAYMGVKVNSVEAADSESVFWNVPLGYFIPGMRSIVKTLSNGGNNTVTARYRVSASTGRWRYRHISVLKFANP